MEDIDIFLISKTKLDSFVPVGQLMIKGFPDTLRIFYVFGD